MVTLWDRTLIGQIIDSLNTAGIHDISVVGGYKEDLLRLHLGSRVKHFYSNPNYADTNMVESLFCAVSELEGDEDVIISYSDIIYHPYIVEQLQESTAPVSVVIDREWEHLWRMRMQDPLSDAETLRVNASGFITELGKKPKSIDEIQGQYIGLIKISKNFLPEFIAHYQGIDRNAVYDKKNFQNMYMTSFIQSIIDRFDNVKAIPIEGGWVEVDSLADLNLYESHGPQLIERNIPLK